MIYRPTIRCLHRILICMIGRLTAFNLTPNFSANQKEDTLMSYLRLQSVHTK